MASFNWPGPPCSAADPTEASAEPKPRSDEARAVAMRLREILSAILSDSPDFDEEKPEEIDTETPFRDLGITSVDFLEFVIALEEEFDIGVPDEALVEDSLRCLDDWAEYLLPRVQGKARTAGAAETPP